MCRRPCNSRPTEDPWKTPPSGAGMLSFPLTSLADDEDPDYDPTEDEDNKATCIYCERDRCEFGIIGFGDGKVRMYGIHEACLAKHQQRTRRYLAREVRAW